jgi:phage protein D
MAPVPPGLQPGTPPQAVASLDDFYVPAYRILLKGQTQPPLQRDVQSVTYHDSLTDVDSVDLVVNNWNPGDPVAGQAMQGSFLYSNGNTFDPWQDIELWMGYYRSGADNLQKMMTGEIVTMAPNFPSSGGSTLTVRALSILHQFRTQQKTLQFKNLTDSEIAKKIVDDIHTDVKKKLPNVTVQMLQSEVNDNKRQNGETPYPYLEMHNQYPIVFLMQRSRDNGYDITTIDETNAKTNQRVITFHYQSSAAVLRPTYVLEWGKSLISFQPTLQTARQVNSLTVTGWNVQTKKAISKTVTRADLVKKGEKLVSPEDLGVQENQLSQKLEITVNRGFKDPNEAQQVAEKMLRQLAQGFVEAKGKTIGLPDLRAGSKVNIYMFPIDTMPPVSDRFSGTYQVTSTTHTINDGGYTTEFSARMEARIAI